MKFLIGLAVAMAAVSLIWLSILTGVSQDIELQFLRGEIEYAEYRATTQRMMGPIYLLVMAMVPFIAGLLLSLKED